MSEALERHFARTEHRRVGKVEHKGFHIYLSEGGPFYDRRMSEFPMGWYEATYGIGKNETPLFYHPLLFDALHDKNLTQESRRQGRINAAKKAAITFIDTWISKQNGK